MLFRSVDAEAQRRRGEAPKPNGDEASAEAQRRRGEAPKPNGDAAKRRSPTATAKGDATSAEAQRRRGEELRRKDERQLREERKSADSESGCYDTKRQDIRRNNMAPMGHH